MRSTRGPLGWGRGPRWLAEGPRLGSRRAAPLTAREAQVWEAETHRSPPTQFHFLFVPSLPSHGVLFEASPRCGRVRSRPREARCVPGRRGPLGELCKSGAPGSSGCGPCTDPGQVRQAGRRVRPVSQGHPRAGTRSGSWGLGPTRRATRGPGKTGRASAAGAFRRRAGRPRGIKGAATPAAAARSAAGPRGPGRGRARTCGPGAPGHAELLSARAPGPVVLNSSTVLYRNCEMFRTTRPGTHGGGDNDDNDRAAHDGQGLLRGRSGAVPGH